MAKRMKNEYLLEIIFEQLDGCAALELANELSDKARLPKLEDGLSEITIDTFKLGLGVIIKNLHLRILEYDSKYDVELNFRLIDIVAKNNKTIQDELHNYALRMANNFKIESFYGGIEPAIDEDTRFFTGARRGPMSL